MFVDSVLTKDVEKLTSDAVLCGQAGFDALWVTESQHDSFLQSLLVANTVPDVSVGTAVAIAFARTPMTLAYSGYDLARYTGGRFILGLGPQIKPHIERRFSMPWSQPAKRMRELIYALRAIWSSWQHNSPLKFEGEFYTHTLMTPNFTPPAHPHGPPPVYLAGVGELMTEVAGEVADGFLGHSFTTERFVREVTLPALDRGWDRGSQDRARPVISGMPFVATGNNTAELDAAIAGIRTRIAFYGSTPAYKKVLDLHGWGEMHARLNTMTKQGRWDEIAAVVPDEVVEEFTVIGSPSEVGKTLVTRYCGLYDRLTFNMPYPHEPGIKADLARAVRSALTDTHTDTDTD
ncbi:MAG TPA: TIGR03617 family F420-dependent LLM class oxidoreductase [Pseudonocardia sp.]|jgi:probable F420-dependent oxidoreductase|nr:TIGR03617 family F420-dependent LLM class oxidoreductase [Pseudonocardia sp.]